MRIVGEIEHPVYKITIMQNMGRFILKFEADATEQSYKLRESDTINSAADIKKLITPAFLQKIDKVFLDLGDNYINLVSQSMGNDNIQLVEGII